MFAHRSRLTALFFFAPIILCFNYSAQTTAAQAGGQQTTPASISLIPCEVPVPNPAIKDKVGGGPLQVLEARAFKGAGMVLVSIVAKPATPPDKAPDPL